MTGCDSVNFFTQSKCRACNALCPLFMALPEPNNWAVSDVLAIHGAFKNNVDLLDTAENGIGGTLSKTGVLSAVNAVPYCERADYMFWDIGCGVGNVLLAAMVFGYGHVTGLEQNDCSREWNLKLRKASAVRQESAHGELWTQKDPVVLWKARVQNTVDLEHYFQKYGWHGKVAVFLFWTAWLAGHKEVVLHFIRTCPQIKYVLVADESKRPQGHRLAFSMLEQAGFTLHRYRPNLTMARSSGWEHFALVCWTRLN